VALDRGLQRAIQTELGARLELPQSFSIESKLFAHFYKDMLSLDALDEGDLDCPRDQPPVYYEGEEPPPPPEDLPAGCQEGNDFARLSAYSYGSEWLIRRDYRETVSGWLSYTLAKADARTDGGRSLTPNFDVRHVANLVFQWRISPKWHVALRGFAQSGRFPFAASGAEDPRERRRLPAFYRGDLQLSRLWARSWGELRFSFDWLNFTFQREPLGWTCEDSLYGGPSLSSNARCSVEYVEFPVTLPMLGVRGTF
jgi:hypothetical protein